MTPRAHKYADRDAALPGPDACGRADVAKGQRDAGGNGNGDGSGNSRAHGGAGGNGNGHGNGHGNGDGLAAKIAGIGGGPAVAPGGGASPGGLAADVRRIWGMTARELHDCFWSSRGIEIVRQRSSQRPLPEARLYLLVDPHSLVLFAAENVIDLLRWPRSHVMLARVQHRDREGYQELVTTDDQGGFVRFERCYQRSTARTVRIGATCDPKLAALWQASRDAKSVWSFLRNTGYASGLETVSVTGDVYDAGCLHEQERLLRELVRSWGEPDSTIANVRRVAPGVWAHQDAEVDVRRTRFIGPTWIGAGRDMLGVGSVLGPAVLWDQRATSAAVHRPPRPTAVAVALASAEGPAASGVDADPTAVTAAAKGIGDEDDDDVRHPRASAGRPAGPAAWSRAWWYQVSKRAFDIVFSLVALAVSLPFYPLVMLALWLEDGRPFFFVHTRETRGGREFGCIKFRTMRKDAETMKTLLGERNQCDGPQFFMVRDPRVTRVGTFLRKHHIDEWPQFWNVLRGDMSVVGPRPSPFKENQFCPAWREARLSVPAGVTGLWQVSRTRSSGRDFREWIEFDVQYVQHRGWRMDLYILCWTLETIAVPRRLRGLLSMPPAGAAAAGASAGDASAGDAGDTEIGIGGAV